TQATAMQLSAASEHQALQISAASTAVNDMAASIDQVSANASESSAVAERSVAIATPPSASSVWASLRRKLATLSV
ncbi:type IV pilus biogenesis protein PilJ, partial [Pseudomonas syringae pv. actinidiae ICMP 18804]